MSALTVEETVGSGPGLDVAVGLAVRVAGDALDLLPVRLRVPGQSATLVAIQTDSAGVPRVVLATISRRLLEVTLARAREHSPVMAASAAGQVSHEVASFVRRQVSGSEPLRSPRELMLARAKSYIDHHIDERTLSPESIAEGIFVSKRYLHVVFQSEGTSVTRYVMARRLEIGRDRLADHRHAHLTVREIGARLGFKDPSHFARVFKAHFGTTPSRYRRHQQSPAE